MTDYANYALRLPSDDYVKLKALSTLTGRSMNSLIAEAVHAFVTDTNLVASPHFQAMRLAADTYQTAIDRLSGKE